MLHYQKSRNTGYQVGFVEATEVCKQEFVCKLYVLIKGYSLHML